MSRVRFSSGAPGPGTGSKLVAAEAKATHRPSALNDGAMLGPLACSPPGPTLTRLVSPLPMVYANTSAASLVSSGTRLLAIEWKATCPQSAGTLVNELPPLAGSPSKPMLASSVVCPGRLRTNTSVFRFVSSGTRLVASELNDTQVQFASIEGRKRCAMLGPLGFRPSKATLTRVVTSAARS